MCNRITIARPIKKNCPVAKAPEKREEEKMGKKKKG